MSGVAAPRDEEPGRPGGARGEFVSSLPRRLDLLRTSLSALEQAPADQDRQNGLLRRMHALGSASRVLGFASVAEALAEAEKALRSAVVGGKLLPLTDVQRTLELLPSLVAGAPESRSPAGPGAYPISVLIFGPQALADAIAAGEGVNVECERTEDAARARELARIIGPDVAVVDADRRGARELVELFARDPLIEPVPVLVVGSFEGGESAAPFVELGAARVLTRPLTPQGLRRAVNELKESASRPKSPREPLGQLTVAALAERMAEEMRRGLVDAVEGGAQLMPVGFGEGADVMAAIWGAVARVRELVTLRSEGAVRFQPIGPEGAVPLSPWGAEERRAGERAGAVAPRAAENVSLQARRVLVADDDPAVVWFMAGLLKAVGAEVLEAHDGRRALEIAHEQWPDVVLSDVLMPELDGFSLCHEIKRDVAVRDTPVILLSWKEDLLQRLRELGADADGYLRKEAAASAVVERVREVLRPRARVEQRIDAGGEVRGRLDGLTVRMLLETVCRRRRDARISVRDAVYLWELAVREGRLLAVTRSSADGEFVRGAAVLPGLLGASAGRFVVEPDSAPVRSEFDGDLAATLSEPIARARAALRAVSASALVRISHMTFDRAAVEAYLACTPEPALQLTRRLLSGVGPRDLVLEGQADPHLLELVLSDLARRGAIHVVEREPGASLVPPPVAPLPAAQTAALEEDLDWHDEELSDDDVQPSMPPARKPDLEPVAILAEPLRVGGDGQLPFNSQVTPGDWTVGPMFAFGDERGTLPGVGKGLPIVEPKIEHAPPSEPVPSSEPVLPLLESKSKSAPPVVAAPKPEPAPVVAAAKPEPEPEPELEPVPTPAPPELAAALVVGRDVRVELEAAPAPPEEPAYDEDDEEPDLGALLTLGDLPISSAFVKPAPKSPAAAPLLDARLFSAKAEPSAPPPKTGHSVFSEPPPVPSAPLTTDALLASLTPVAPEVTHEPELPVPELPVPEKPPGIRSPQLSSFKRTSMQDFAAVVTPSSASIEPTELEPTSGLDLDDQAPVATQRSLPAPRSRAPRTPEVSEPPLELKAPVSIRPRPVSTVGPLPMEKPGWIGPALLAVVSGLVVYYAVRLVRDRLTAEDKPPEVPAAVASVVVPKPAPKVEPRVETLPLPSGMDVPSGMGLLEVQTPGPVVLYVDGDFVGRGPLRRVPLSPGRHELAIGEGAERSALPIELTAASRTRVSVPRSTP